MKAKNINELNEISKRFGIQVISFENSKRIGASQRAVRQILCKCKCGKIFITRTERISSGHTKSCGCDRLKSLILRNTKYENNVLKINKLYIGIMTRCYNTNHPTYGRYGGRGVTVCDEWRNSYPAFLKWCLENGWKEGLHLDKDIKGTTFLYSPENCVFVTPKENLSFPKRKTRFAAL